MKQGVKRAGKALVLVLCSLLVACETPNFFPNWRIEVAPSTSPDSDLKRLDELAARHDFLPAPLGRDLIDPDYDPVQMLRAYQLRDRRTLHLSIGWAMRHERYFVFVTDIGHASLQLRGLECRKYLDIVADLTGVFGASNVVPSRMGTCDPTA